MYYCYLYYFLEETGGVGQGINTGKLFRLEERSPCAAGSAWALIYYSPRCMCDFVAFEEALTNVHADLDEVMKPKMFSSVL